MEKKQPQYEQLKDLAKLEKLGRLSTLSKLSELAKAPEKSAQKQFKNMALYLSGQLISLFGSAIYSFAISLYILKTTGSGLSFAISLVLGTLPRVIFGPVAGVLADKVDRKRLSVLLDLAAGVLVMGLWALSGLDAPRIPYLYVTTFLLSSISTFYGVTMNAATPNLVGEKQLMRINSLGQAIGSMSGIGGPFLGGICYALVDIRLFFLINGLSFLFAAVTTLFIDFHLAAKIDGTHIPAKPGSVGQNKQTQKGQNRKVQKGQKQKNKQKQRLLPTFFADLKEGLVYMKSQRWLIVFSGFAVLFNFFFMLGLTVPVPYIVNTLWKFTPQQFGMLNMTIPVGMLITSLLIAMIPQPKRMLRQIIISMLLFSVGMFTIGMVASEQFFQGTNLQYLIIFMCCYFIMAVSSVMINVPIGVALQKLVPDNKRGRVQGTLGTMAQAFTPIGAILAGALIGGIPPWTLPVACSVILLGLTILMAREKELQTL